VPHHETGRRRPEDGLVALRGRLDEADPLPEELDWENPATLAMLTERTTRITWLSLK
jgi:hypothetical protein